MKKDINRPNNWKLPWICAISVGIVFFVAAFLSDDIVRRYCFNWDRGFKNLFVGLVIGLPVGATLGVLTGRQVLEKTARIMLGISVASGLDVYYLYDHKILLLGVIFFISLLILWTDVFNTKYISLLLVPVIVVLITIPILDFTWLIPVNPGLRSILIGTAAAGFITGILELDRKIDN